MKTDYKIGDEVRVLSSWFPQNVIIGKKYTVVSIEENRHVFIDGEIQAIDAPGWCMFFNEIELWAEIISNEPEVIFPGNYDDEELTGDEKLIEHLKSEVECLESELKGIKEEKIQMILQLQEQHDFAKSEYQRGLSEGHQNGWNDYSESL